MQYPNRNNMNEDQFERIKYLLTKELLSQLDEKEASELKLWRESSLHNEDLYRKLTNKEYVNKRYDDFNEVISSKGFSNYRDKKINWFKGYRRYAAIFIFALVTLSSLYHVITEIRSKHSLNYQYEKMAVSLKLDDTKTIDLNTVAINSDIENVCIKTDKNTLVYNRQGGKKFSIHEISIPEAKVFKVILPDGSIVWLNSKSTLSYPTRFNEKSRTVSLDGEGYFEIAKDKTHPFKVNVNGMIINVTGTHFNVKAYKEDHNVSTTLAEGSVDVAYKDKYGREKSLKLKPGEQSDLDKIQGDIAVKEVNTSIYTSWKDGIYFFDKQRLEDIMNDLGRWYGLTVVFADNDIKNKVMTGKLKRNDTPEELLNSFAKILPGHIKIQGKTLTIY